MVDTAVILAAGKGERMNGLGGDLPKCLVPLGGVSLIERQIRALRQERINRIAVVVGFGAARVREVCGSGIHYIENRHYSETNSLFSLWLARPWLSDGFVVLNADVLFHTQLLRDLLTARYQDALLVSYRDDLAAPLGDEEMKVRVRAGKVIDITKQMNPSQADAENVGIAKFGAAGTRLLSAKLQKLIEEGKHHDWAPSAFREFSTERALYAIGTRGYPWMEIDFPEDYRRAVEEVMPMIASDGDACQTISSCDTAVGDDRADADALRAVKAFENANVDQFSRRVSGGGFKYEPQNRLIRLARRMEQLLPRLRATRNVLINARTPMNYAVVRPICEAMRNDPRVRFYFTASEKPVDEVYRGLATEGPVITPRRAAPLKFDAYIAADLLWLKLFRATRRIQMFHGVAGKYASAYESQSSREWYRVFFVNKRRLRSYIEAGAIDRDSANARMIGYPKVDCLVNGSLKPDEVLNSLGLDPTKPCVLYAPTWSPYSSLNAMGEELVKMLCSSGCTVIVKLHDRSQCPEYVHSGGTDWHSRLAPLLKHAGGVLANGSDASPYLAAADVLITDHSSVGFEYLLLDRPVIRIEMPDLIEKTGIRREYVSLLAEASHSVTRVDEVARALRKALAQPSLKSDSRRYVAGEVFYKPGTATARAVRELYEVIELDPPAAN